LAQQKPLMTKFYQQKNSLFVIALAICISLFSEDSYAQACHSPLMVNHKQSMDIKTDSPVYEQLEEVIVVGYNKRKIECGWSVSSLQGKQLSNAGTNEGAKLTMLRCIASGVYVTSSNSVSDSIKLVTPKVAMNIYPNPTQAGTSVNLKLQNERPGIYKIEIFDVSGRVVEAKYVKVIFKNQVILFSTSPGWIKGTYLIRVSQSTGTNVEVGKLVIN